MDEYFIKGKNKTPKINKQTFIKQKLKIGVVLALSEKTKKAYTFPVGGITIYVQGIKRKF